MTPQEEFQTLLQQATEHLRYYRELGITHFGESFETTAESLTQIAVPPVSVELPVAENAEPALPTLLNPSSMPDKKSTTEATPLFGEAPFGGMSSTVPELQFADDNLDNIRADLGDCQRCKLWKTRTNIVFGEGNPKAELMIVGEAPGADEDASGRPFVGRAGQLLTKMIEAIQFSREDVYIANILKSRPPDNRNPEADETKACIPFLYRQIAVIRPKLIVTLGNPATQGLLDTKVGITKLRGEFQEYPRLPGIKVMPTFHPAYLLRSPDKKREAWEDLKKVRAFLRGE
ncbi:MAG: uracil-DNA glycosylase [Blastocatellia bacterium]|nr:uracil-DNA glycosylase [Blastocatellia bacterium]